MVREKEHASVPMAAASARTRSLMRRIVHNSTAAEARACDEYTGSMPVSRQNSRVSLIEEVLEDGGGRGKVLWLDPQRGLCIG